MISSEVQRTLVKSPPELWAEINDPESLARHLGELGEIRITGSEPETLVEWESDGASGTIAIKASGWGTRVTLTAARDLQALEAIEDLPEACAEEVGPAQEADSSAELEAEARPEIEPAQEIEAATAPESESTAEAEIEPAAEETFRAPAALATERRGFFARLFGRRRTQVAEPPTIEDQESLPGTDVETAREIPTSAIDLLQARFAPAEPAPTPETAPAMATPEDLHAPTPLAEDRPEDESVDLADELQAAEEVAAKEVTAVLTAVLDRLGAAHHRPFSRS